MLRYQVRSFAAKIDREFEVEADARAFAESLGVAVEMIKWAVSPNLPNALPALVYRSCALEVFDPSTGWRGVNIHGC